ncbi:sugar O-acetyltransferase [Lacticaseibacillus sp. GG6-2]
MRTEKEKFLAGEPYQIFDPELAADETKARRLCAKLNALDDTQTVEKQAVLSQLFGQVGKNCYVEPNFRCDFGYHIFVGDNFICNYDSVILDIAPVHIGSDVMFGPHVQIYAATHPLDAKRRKARIGMGAPITIGDNVWLGGGVTVLPGVTIGDNTVVGANSTVTHDFGPNLIVAGNPARVIRENPE